MKETEFFYEPCVDEAQTIRNMKRQLLFLKQYSRFWIESLRTDQLLLPKVGLPVSQLLAGTIVIVSAILVITGRKKAARIKSTE